MTTIDPSKISRVERKKQETRARIISEAERLMRSRPVDEITIQDITDAADVGHGSFYLHFKSKYEVLIPIVQRTADEWDQLIQERFDGDEDPAVVVASSTRYMGRVITADPLWHWMLKHAGMPVEEFRDAIGRFAARDLGKGLLSGRFKLPELSLGSGFLLGAYVNGLLTSFEAEDPHKAIDQLAELLLRVLGIDIEEAERIAHTPLPVLASLSE